MEKWWNSLYKNQKHLFKLIWITYLFWGIIPGHVLAQTGDMVDVITYNDNKTGSIDIKYVDSISGKPIRYVTIKVLKNDTTIDSTSLVSVNYHSKLLPGKYKIYSSHKEYFENIQSVVIYGDINCVLTIYMIPKKYRR